MRYEDGDEVVWENPCLIILGNRMVARMHHLTPSVKLLPRFAVRLAALQRLSSFV